MLSRRLASRAERHGEHHNRQHQNDKADTAVGLCPLAVVIQTRHETSTELIRQRAARPVRRTRPPQQTAEYADRHRHARRNPPPVSHAPMLEPTSVIASASVGPKPPTASKARHNATN
jgi:hypothetical protein